MSAVLGTMSGSGIRTLFLWLGWMTIFALGDVNVARGKSYSQSSMHPAQQNDNVAANGDTSQEYPKNCIHTREDEDLYKDHPWYEVDLGRIYPVYSIDIWARSNYNFRLYPSTITVDSEACTTVTTFPTTSREKEVTCSSVMYGQRVRITLDKTTQSLNLCEMEIWVPDGVSQCPAGQYGSSCDLTCSEHCGQGPGKNFCHQSSADCYDGCAAGWYGDLCSTACSQGCPNNTCDQESGECSPCNTGYRGDNCSDCFDGYYKRPDNTGCDECTWSCQSGTVCDKTTGHCLVCPPGKQGHHCDKDCERGRYGQNCTGECGHCANEHLSDSCQAVTGECTYGCQNGWRTVLCTEECEDGSWGASCIKSCGQCKEGAVCNKENGQCPLCDPGWYSPLCDTPCQDGWYGNTCSQQCGRCMDDAICNRTTGYCPVCAIGKQPPFCDADCQNKKYGENCTKTCGQCREGQPCDPVAGQCPNGCQPGWTDLTPSSTPLCQAECPDGYYGQRCNATCGYCRLISECRHDTGHCTGQCAEGFTGPLCTERDHTDNQSTIIIGSAVGAGFFFLGICVVIVGIIWARRFKKASRQSRDRQEGTRTSNAPSRTVTAAERRQAAPVSPGVGLQHAEHPYEKLEDVAMTTRAVYLVPSDLPDIKVHVSDAALANTYDHASVQYQNTGEVHLYE